MSMPTSSAAAPVFDPRTAQGLGDAEAARRLAAEGPNELPTEKPRSLLLIALSVVRQPMFLLLLGAGGLYLVLGDRQEALTLLSFVLVVIGITLYQERKTERALAALRDLSSPRALVIRAGRTLRVAGREVVRGDLVVLAEGDRVPMDGALREASNLQVDESLLTGESVPVRKRAAAMRAGAGDAGAGDAGAAPAEPMRPGGDDLPWVFSGTLVVRGRGVAEARATGAGTEIGRIGRALAETSEERTPLEREVDLAVRRVALAGVALCAVLVVVYGLTRGDWTRGFLAGITLAMAVLPEEFPVVLTVFMALGAWRIARSNVLTRRVPAIEALGATTVLCVDKTGTLTENKMTVARLYAPAAGACEVAASREATGSDAPAGDGGRGGGGGGALPEDFHALVEFGILASQRDPFDPMERAFHALGAHALAGTEHLHGDWSLVREYPLSPELLALSHVWRAPGGARRVVAAKGAPESIADLCHLPPAHAEALLAQTRAMAAEGLRVLGVARAYFAEEMLPAGQHDFEFELLGLVGLRDPLRAGVPAAVAECHGAGIRVVMITGDYPETARTIAREAGIAGAGADALTGAEIDALDEPALAARLRDVCVVARAAPEHKLRIVRAFKRAGDVVAMTGDGVNDAPALRAADIGLAMGGRGTDVAREAAALVLTADDFESIVDAVRLGRRIYDNLRKAVAYILAVHVPMVGMSLLPVLLRWPLALLPVHVVFLELVIDPACSVVFEAEPAEDDVMRRPPRRAGQHLFSARRVVLALLQGASTFVPAAMLFACELARGGGADRARALAFVAVLAGNLALIAVNRSWSRTALGALRRRNAAQWWVLLGAVGFVLFGLFVPAGRALFHFAGTQPLKLLVAAGAGVAALTWFEVLKLVRPAVLGGDHPQG
jgi:Ca2+-transporting ATPase